MIKRLSSIFAFTSLNSVFPPSIPILNNRKIRDSVHFNWIENVEYNLLTIKTFFWNSHIKHSVKTGFAFGFK